MATGTKGSNALDGAVRAHLHDRGVPFDVIIHPKAFTSIDEARAIGVEADDVLKTVVIESAAGRALMIVPASRRLDMHRVHRAVGDPHARLATEDEVAEAFPGFALGAIPPLGSLLDVPAFVDPAVLDHETVVFAAGIRTESIRVRTEDLFIGEAVHIVRLTREPPDDDDGKELFE